MRYYRHNSPGAIFLTKPFLPKAIAFHFGVRKKIFCKVFFSAATNSVKATVDNMQEHRGWSGWRLQLECFKKKY